MKLTESKSSLSRLMSEENILVEQRSGVQSAYFDTSSRLLVVPELKEEVSSNVLDVFLSHEVSHALHTPNDAWIEAISELKLNKTILNVVEDARIEREIKSKYPGLKRIYHAGYKELLNIDFFGLSNIDVDSLNLIDRINLYFKVGFLEFVTFTEEENKFVVDTENAKTFADVVKVSKEIQDYMKQELENQFETMSISIENMMESGETGSVETENKEFVENKSYGDVSNSSSGERNEKTNEEENSSGSSEEDEFGPDNYSSLEDYLNEELRSHTQESSETKIKELYKEDDKPTIYVDIPDINLNQYIIDYSIILQKLKTDVDSHAINVAAYKNFKEENSSIISYVIKEFNLKKNAEGRKKVKVSKTGDINLNKLYAYKISEDIFKRSAIVPKEQSHGLVFFLDWSGSMTNCMTDTIRQLLILLTFCKKVNIPFEVYAFTTNYPSCTKSSQKHGNMFLDSLNLMNLFSSRMPNNKFIEMCNYFLCFNGHTFMPNVDKFSFGYPCPNWLHLGNTPLNHTVILSNLIMEEFKNRTKVQIANAIYLTDGDSHGISFFVKEKSRYDSQEYFRSQNLNTAFYNVYLRDRKSNEVVKYQKSYCAFDETNQIASFVRKMSDFKMFAFRLASVKELKSFHYKTTKDYSSPDTKKFNQDNCLEMKSEFDKFYFVKTNSLNCQEEMGSIEGKSSSSIARQFQKIMSNKVNSKIFLNKFVEFIS